MSLIEWIGEAYDPGPTGSVAFGGDNSDMPSRGRVLFFGLISFSILMAGLYFIFYVLPMDAQFPALGGLLVYLVVSYFVKPNPDMSNLGWLGGLMDNPFRISDDINRFLLLLKVIFIPGRHLVNNMKHFCIVLYQITS